MDWRYYGGASLETDRCVLKCWPCRRSEKTRPRGSITVYCIFIVSDDVEVKQAEVPADRVVYRPTLIAVCRRHTQTYAGDLRRILWQEGRQTIIQVDIRASLPKRVVMTAYCPTRINLVIVSLYCARLDSCCWRARQQYVLLSSHNDNNYIALRSYIQRVRVETVHVECFEKQTPWRAMCYKIISFYATIKIFEFFGLNFILVRSRADLEISLCTSHMFPTYD